MPYADIYSSIKPVCSLHRELHGIVTFLVSYRDFEVTAVRQSFCHSACLLLELSQTEKTELFAQSVNWYPELNFENIPNLLQQMKASSFGLSQL